MPRESALGALVEQAANSSGAEAKPELTCRCLKKENFMRWVRSSPATFDQ
jgi:hypothetical protein